MNKTDTINLRDKIIKGLELAWTRLIDSKKKDNAELVFSKNGQIVKIKAADLK